MRRPRRARRADSPEGLEPKHWTTRSGLIVERELAIGQADRHGPAVFEAAKEDLVCQRIADLGLYHASQRTRAIDGVVTFFSKPQAGLRLQRDGDPPFGELRLELQDELLDDGFHHRR